MKISGVLGGMRKHNSSPPASWLNIAAMLADVVFEMDTKGRFTAFGPGNVLGFPQSKLLGTSAAAVFTGPETAFAEIISGICKDLLVWHGKTILRDADGVRSKYRLAMAPLINESGVATGICGLLFDMNAPELTDPDPVEPAEFGQVHVSPLLCPETGLWSFDSFMDQAGRRFDRLDVENLPGTLILLGFIRAKPNLRKPVAMKIAEELREIVRPTDMLVRLTQTIIAIWCDGMDHLTGSERAARFCTNLPHVLPGETLISAGLVTRWPGSADSPLQVIERAKAALKQADRASEHTSSGTWRVWQKDTTT
jgi:GGDEF domain-containing protein